MTPESQREAYQFIFKEFGKPIWWKPGSLTKEGNPNGNSPELNIAEAESVFRTLTEKDLIFPFINEHKEACFLIHHAKKPEWEDLIDTPPPPTFLQKYWKQILIWIGTFLLWASSLIYSTYITKTVENRIEKSNEKIMKWEIEEKEPQKQTEDPSTNNVPR